MKFKSDQELVSNAIISEKIGDIRMNHTIHSKHRSREARYSVFSMEKAFSSPTKHDIAYAYWIEAAES
ncbi:hypothetical protein GGP41_009637 [Bipolaris sorokiniana]|uniref:Uncharacterized protein n=1 Tax=Cochliobolus sativus TaxID=45130 RepID=A0A8H5ZDF5_COCSA|nr:hypothetical protein GGP41_009637 [Bipolaris sorokiniana]